MWVLVSPPSQGNSFASGSMKYRISWGRFSKINRGVRGDQFLGVHCGLRVTFALSIISQEYRDRLALLLRIAYL